MAGPPVGIKGHMDIAYLSTLSALAGSVVGGLTSGVATWLSQRVQARESQLAREMARRDDLYKEFIAAASKAYGEAIVSNEPNVQQFVALYAMISRMRLQSPQQTVACAEKIMRATIDTYFAPGKTIREFHELLQSVAGIDLLKDFSEVAREELRAFTTLWELPKRLVRFSARSVLREWILERTLDWLGAGHTDHVYEG